MITDIPNYISFPFEIFIAFMILYLDRQEKRREKSRFTDRVDFEDKQRERFNNFIKESNKSQLYLLESILDSLDHEKAEYFKKNIQAKYKDEIEEDMSNLEDLLTQSMEDGEGLNDEILHKMDELDSSSSIASSLFSDKISEGISNITKSTKNIFDQFSSEKLFEKGKLRENLRTTINAITKEKDDIVSEFEKMSTSEEGIEKEIKKEVTTDQISNLLSKFIPAEELEKIKKHLKKDKEE